MNTTVIIAVGSTVLIGIILFMVLMNKKIDDNFDRQFGNNCTHKE